MFMNKKQLQFGRPLHKDNILNTVYNYYLYIILIGLDFDTDSILIHELAIQHRLFGIYIRYSTCQKINLLNNAVKY